VFWTANTANPREQVTQETLLNGVVSNRAFDAVTGWVKTIQSGVGGGTGVQNLEYAWDQVGNLSSRKDKNQSSLTESFSYDNLYRLKAATLSTGPSITYDYNELGNIMSKSDVGSYTYYATKKHQVASTSLPTNWSFGYDLNGNMTSGRGATLTWTSYNYPASITSGSDTAAFNYTPDRQYWKQVSNYSSGGAATTLYIGGLLEKVTTSSGTDYRHYIRAGGSTIIVSRQSTGTNSFYYLTSDHLGSSSAITNSAGGILVNESFDAFGKRRGANWTGNPSAGDWSAIASTTRRGFTEHSMLDNLGLIHMNGRVQDPWLGRFVSADPFVTEPLNTQGYNRYSYVANNPLSFSDPSGFEKDEPDDDVRRCRVCFTSSFPSLFGTPVGLGWFYQMNREAIMELPDWESNSPGPNVSKPQPPQPTDSTNAWSGIDNPYCDMSPTGCAQSGPQDTPPWQLGKYVCFETGCLRPDGTWEPHEPGLESVDWTDPIVLGSAYGVGKVGCEGDCQTAVLLYGALVTRSKSAAAAAMKGTKLTRHLYQLEKYGAGGFKELANGRIRYYGTLDAARDAGTMIGRRVVREWDPATGATRTWHETLDSAGRVRIVRPETGGPGVHYVFDEAGNYVGSW